MAYNEINVIAVGSVVMVVRTTKLGRFISLLNIKIYTGKIRNKKDNDMATDVAQLERNNNKYYASTFRYI